MEFLKQAWMKIAPDRRQEIIHRLVEMAEDNITMNFDMIFRNCLTDQDAIIRNQAIQGLWENEDASSIAPLINLLKHDSSAQVRATAAASLGKFAMLAEFEKLRPVYKTKIKDALLAIISDTSQPVEVRRRALESVASLSSPRIKKAIAAAYHSDDSKLKISAIYAMGQSYDSVWLPFLLQEMNNIDAESRYEAACACGELEQEAAVPHLIKLINDPDVEVQLAAIQALGKIGGIEAKNQLEQCLNNSSPAIQEQAKHALEEIEANEDSFPFHL